MRKLPGFITISLLIIFTAAHSKSESFNIEKKDGILTDFEKSSTIPGGGNVRIQYQFTGEPVSAPARLRIYVKCKASKEETLFQTLKMCHLTRLNFDQGLSLLTTHFVVGRIDENSRSKCDLPEEKEIQLARVCKSGLGK